MKIRTFLAATRDVLLFSIADAVSAHVGEAETVKTSFEAAIPNIAASR